MKRSSQAEENDKKPKGIFSSIEEIEQALENKSISLHSKIVSTFKTIDKDGKTIIEKYTSTAGRFLLANVLPKNHNIKFNLVNKLLTKKNVSEVIDTIFRYCGQKETVIFCDRIKTLGFKHAFKAGISFGKDDLIIPKTKENLISSTKKQIEEFEKQYSEKEVNQIIKNHHSFNDVPLLRRELISRLFLNRKDDGSVYWKNN